MGQRTGGNEGSYRVRNCLGSSSSLSEVDQIGNSSSRKVYAEDQAACPYRWTSHRPVVSPEGRVFGRPGNRQALNRAYQYLDLVSKGRHEEGFKFPMEWVRRRNQY